MAGWIKMPLGREVGLGTGGILLDGDPAPPSKKGGGRGTAQLPYKVQKYCNMCSTTVKALQHLQELC